MSLLGKLRYEKTQRYKTCHKRKKKELFIKTNFAYYKVFHKFLAIEMKKIEILTNTHACLGVSILELSKTLMYELWYDYVKPKYDEKARLGYMDTDIV